MNFRTVRTFLVGALCGAVMFAIIDRLVQTHERRRALDEKPVSAARARSDSAREELQTLTDTAPSLPPPQEPESSSDEDEADAAEEGESADMDSRAHSEQPASLPQSPADGVGRKDTSAADRDSQTPPAGSAKPQTADDTSWGPYMEQNLRQFMARHRSATQFDVLGIHCATGQCEMRAAGFDESTWPVWGQVLYDLTQQPWYEFGEAASEAGRIDGRYVLTAKLKRLPRE